jgi:hypothetical protein
MVYFCTYCRVIGILNYTKRYFILLNSKAGLALSVIGIAAVLMLVLAPIAANHQTFGQDAFSVRYHVNLAKPETAIPQSTSKSSSGPSSSSSSSGGTSGPSSSSSSSGGTSGPSSMHVTHVTVHHHKKHKGGHSGPSGSSSSSGY